MGTTSTAEHFFSFRHTIFHNSTLTMSSAAIPKTTKAWTVEGQDGFESLKLNNEAPIPDLFDNEVLVKFHAASLDTQTIATGLGGVIDGTLRQYGTFNEAGLVEMPESLNWQEASTLSCAAVTAWNALYGLKPLVPGDVVLTQGTGGVSIFAVQFAKAAGATVIATTSSSEKEAILKKLGADHVINYKDVPEWGEKAASLTPKKAGVNHILEVGGPKTMAQSLKAVKIDGVISIIGFLGGNAKEQPSFLDALSNVCTVRGILVGSRQQFEDMNRAIEVNGIKPVVDEKIFSLEQVKEAYQYMWDQKHFGKLTIKIE